MKLSYLLNNLTDSVCDDDIVNVDNLSYHLLINEFQNSNKRNWIISLQNEDGGFGYQQGLSSNAYLSAEIADILVDTVNVNPILSYYLEDTFTALDEYLDSVFPVISELSENDLDQVYQHFYTALYRLKRVGRYDVTPYYDLQAENGGVFDDPMATALFLELLVREQNALVAKLDTIAIKNDRGYAVSAFNSNENVNISVDGEYESEKAYETYTSADVIYRVSRKSTLRDVNGQGTGREYLGTDGKWYHESTLIPEYKDGTPNPNYNDDGAKNTHIEAPKDCF